MHANDNDQGPVRISTGRARALAAAVLETLAAAHAEPTRGIASVSIMGRYQRP